MSMHGNRWWLAGPAAALAVLFVAFGASGYASWHIDANYLTVPAVAWASGQGFVNPIWPAAQALDPQGIGRFLYHGPGFQLLLRAFLHPPTGAQALLVIQSLNALNVIVFAWFLGRVARRYPGTRFVTRVASLAALLSFAAILMTATGRPETLAILLVLAGAHLLLPRSGETTQGFWRTALVGALLGLLAVTHPLNAVEMGLILAVWYGLHQAPRTALLYLGTAGGVAVVVALTVMATLFPFPVADWVAGMRAHTAIVTDMFDTRVVRFLMVDSRHPAYGLTLLAATLVCLIWWWRHRGGVRSPWMVYLAAPLLALIVTRFSLFVAFRAYDSYPVFGVLAAGLIVAAGQESVRWRRIAIVAALGLPGVGFARLALLFPFYLTSGMSLSDARQALAETLAEEQGPVGITQTLWVLTEDYGRLRLDFDLGNVDERTGEPLEVVVVQQHHYASVEALPGYRKVRSHRRSGVPSLAGLPLAWSVPGYQFDVYRRDPTSTAGNARDAPVQPRVPTR